jgi:hypothetical protein
MATGVVASWGEYIPAADSTTNSTVAFMGCSPVTVRPRARKWMVPRDVMETSEVPDPSTRVSFTASSAIHDARTRGDREVRPDTVTVTPTPVAYSGRVHWNKRSRGYTACPTAWHCGAGCVTLASTRSMPLDVEDMEDEDEDDDDDHHDDDHDDDADTRDEDADAADDDDDDDE